MALNAEQITNQLGAFLHGLTFRQKMTLVVGVLVVAGTLWAFVTLLDRAEYKTLYSGLSTSDGQSLARRLTEKNVPYELSSDGTSLRVPANQLDKVRLDLAAEGLPQTGRLGFELFDKPNWTGSDFAEKVNYQRALEGELERTIQTLGEIEAVRVHLVLPRESLFTEQDRAAKASVVVKLRAGRLGDEAQEAITHLVASAVENLKPENVTLINADGGVPILARGGGPGSRPRYWAEFETALAEKVVATLEPVVGPGKARANVTAEYDLGTSDSTQETYDPNAEALLTTQISTERVDQTNAEGAPGTPSNVPGKQAATGVKPPSEDGTETQGLHTESKTFAVSKTVRHVVQPSGSLKRVTAAVLVDDATESKEENGKKTETRRKRTPDEMKQIEELVAAAIGIDATRGDKVAVANLSFQTLPFEAPRRPSLTDRVAPLVDKWINVVRYGALLALFLLVYLLILRPIKSQIVATFRDLPRQLAAAKSAGAALKGGSTLGRAVGKDGAPPETEEGIAPELGASVDGVRQAVLVKKSLLDKAKKEPANFSRLIQNWLRQETKI